MKSQVLSNKKLANLLKANLESENKLATVLADFEKSLSPKQLAYYNDTSPYIAVVCGRRAGKTRTSIGRIFKKAFTKRSKILYTAPTRSQAKDIIWDDLKELDNRYQLNLKFNEADLTVTFPNRSKLMVRSAADRDKIGRLKGRDLDLAIIDEGQDYKWYLFAPLIDDVIEPALARAQSHGEGELIILGTPGLNPAGHFFELAATALGDKYSKHHFTIRDNPSILNPDKVLDQLRTKNGWSEQNPTYKREWLGEWVLDLDSQVYKIKKNTALTQTIPPGNYTYIIGLDIGWHDDTAFVVIGYREHDKKLYVVESHGEAHILPNDIAKRLATLSAKYNNAQIYMDTGGGGARGNFEEWRTRYNLPILPATKTDKNFAIANVNADFHDGLIQIHPDTCLGLIHEMETLVWDPNSPLANRKEKPGQANHQCDAFLYAYRSAKHFLMELQPHRPALNTAEYIKAEEQRLLDSLIERSKDKSPLFQQNEWEDLYDKQS